jgi:hypothetical protein
MKNTLTDNIAALPFQKVDWYTKITGSLCPHALTVTGEGDKAKLFCPLCKYELEPHSKVQVLRTAAADLWMGDAKELLR